LTLAGVPFSHLLAAAARPELYQAVVPLSDRSDGAQSVAFQSALRIVLVRVTGRRAAENDPALAPLTGNARRYVQQYRNAPDNKLWVAFDGPAIERWLTQNGQPLWGRDRPATYVFLALQTGAQSGVVATADDTSELKSAIDAAAAGRGIPLIWPSAADLQRDHVDFAAVNAAAPTLIESARAHGADGVLIGRASNGTAGASVRWTQVLQDRNSEYSGALEGVNRLADTYAGMYAASGALAPVDIDVSGVTSVRDYANVQTYLESLTFITHVNVIALSADTVKFRLMTRGGVEPLQHALALNGKLQAVPGGDAGTAHFQLRR